MKSNEAPEKLWWSEGAVWHTNPNSQMYIEYIRKDAFIEKAAKWLEDNAIEYWGTEAVDNGMMIDDFKKAMKL